MAALLRCLHGPSRLHGFGLIAARGQRIVGHKARREERQAQRSMEPLQDLERARLHLYHGPGDVLDNVNRPARSSKLGRRFGKVSVARSGSNSAMIDCSRIRAVRLSAPNAAKGSSVVKTLLDLSRRSRRTDPTKPFRVLACQRKRVRSADRTHERRSIDREKRYLVDHVANVAQDIEALDEGLGPQPLHLEEWNSAVERPALGLKLLRRQGLVVARLTWNPLLDAPPLRIA